MSMFPFQASLWHTSEMPDLSAQLPPILNNYMPRWPSGQTEIAEYRSGFIATQCLKEQDYECCFCLVSFSKKHISRFSLATALTCLFIQRKECCKLTGLGGAKIEMAEGSCCLLYIPPGEYEVEFSAGNNISMVVAMQKGTISASEMYKLSDARLDVWLLAPINLLLNIGKDNRYEPSVRDTLIILFQNYYISLQSISDREKRNHFFYEMTGKRINAGTATVSSHSWDVCSEIEYYLFNHLKKNYTKTDMARKTGLSVKAFSRLIKEVYGKNFKEAYPELKMIRVLEWVVQNNKLVEIALDAGYVNAANLSTEFKRLYRFPPSFFQWPYLSHKFSRTPY